MTHNNPPWLVLQRRRPATLQGCQTVLLVAQDVRMPLVSLPDATADRVCEWFGAAAIRAREFLVWYPREWGSISASSMNVRRCLDSQENTLPYPD